MSYGSIHGNSDVTIHTTCTRPANTQVLIWLENLEAKLDFLMEKVEERAVSPVCPALPQSGDIIFYQGITYTLRRYEICYDMNCFEFSWVQGNDNNFISLRQCWDTCGSVQVRTEPGA